MGRKLPSVSGPYKPSPEEKMVSEMNSALWALADEVRETEPRAGAKLLPAGIGGSDPQEREEAKLAKSHIRKLYTAFKAARKE